MSLSCARPHESAGPLMINFAQPCRRGHPKTADHGRVTPDGYWFCNACNRDRRANVPSTHNAALTRCKNGHPLTPENVRVRRQTPAQYRQRDCVQCDHERAYAA